MKNNRFIENYKKIAQISKEQQKDLEVACLIFVSNEKLTNWSKEKEEFDVAYKKWFLADFKGEIADYVGN